MKKFIPVMRYAMGVLLFAGGAILASKELCIAAFVLFFALGVMEAALLLKEGAHLLSLPMLFSASWTFGIALSSLKLSALQKTWGVRTWLALGLFYFLFLLAYGLLSRVLQKKGKNNTEEAAFSLSARELSAVRAARIIVLSLSLLGLLLEAIKFDFVFPLFASGKPHAYTEFHISGVHYFVVSCVFVPALSMLEIMGGEKSKKQILTLLLVNFIALLIPVLLLSKFQLALFFAFPILIWARLTKKLSAKRLALLLGGAFLLLAGLFALLISFRDYEPGYLESIFRFKNRNVPVVLQYPYIYVVNNFENFNLLVENLTHFLLGKRELYPFACLTGLKFNENVMSFFIWENIPITIEELTTRTILYDVYYDFGLIGSAVFGLLLGGLSAYVGTGKNGNGIFTKLLYAQLAVYFGLAFFDVWFSVPTTWFWLAATAAIALFVKITGNRRKANGT